MISGGGGVRLGAAAAVLLLAAGTGLADQYWVAYEGNDYPENEGWWRISYEVPPERSLQDGALVLDTRADVMIAEFYEWPPVGDLDPDAGELFLLQWRVLIDGIPSGRDSGVSVVGEGEWGVKLRYNNSSVLDLNGAAATFEPGVFHEYELRSYDMRTYDFYIDGAFAWHSVFSEHWGRHRVTFGAATQGATSLSYWDYVRFGVVPEPHSVSSVAILVLLVLRGRRPVGRGVSQLTSTDRPCETS